jgi:hypothetical protein
MSYQDAIEYIDAHIEDRTVFLLFRAEPDSLNYQVYVPLMVKLKHTNGDFSVPNFQMPRISAASGAETLYRAMGTIPNAQLELYIDPSVENVTESWDEGGYEVVQLPSVEEQPPYIHSVKILNLMKSMGVYNSIQGTPPSLLVSVKEPGINIGDIMRGEQCGEYHSRSQLLASGSSWGTLLGCSILILTELVDGTQDVSSICAVVAIITGAVLVVTNGAEYDRCLGQAEWRPPKLYQE